MASVEYVSEAFRKQYPAAFIEDEEISVESNGSVGTASVVSNTISRGSQKRKHLRHKNNIPETPSHSSDESN